MAPPLLLLASATLIALSAIAVALMVPRFLGSWQAGQSRLPALAPARATGFVIHLGSRTDRRRNVESLQRNAAAAGISLEVFAARDGRRCRPLRVRPFADFSRGPGVPRDYLRGGEQGCLASFLEVWRRLRRRGGFCLEDDAVVSAANFARMGAALERLAASPCVLYGFRAFPRGYHGNQGVARREAATADLVCEGWRTVLVPNYSNACFALTAPAAERLDAWLARRRAEGTHRLPADDLLSAAGGAHALGLPSADITLLAPASPLAERLRSASDTEPQRAEESSHPCELHL